MEIKSCRFLWQSENILFTVSDGTFTHSLSIGKSSSDADAIGAITEAAVRGVVKGAKGL